MIVFCFCAFFIIPLYHLPGTHANKHGSLYHNYVCIFVLVYTSAFVYFCVFFSCVLLRLGHVQSTIYTVFTLTANYDSLNSGRDYILHALLSSAGNLFNFASERVQSTE